MATGNPGTRQRPYRLIAFLTLAALGVMASGYFFFVSQERTIKVQAENELMAVTELKVGQVTNWLEERLRDGQVMQWNPLISSRVKDFLKEPQSLRLRNEIMGWLHSLQKYHEYDGIFLLDPAGRTLLSTDGAEGSTAYDRKLADEAIQRGTVTISDFLRRGKKGTIHIDLAVPIAATEKGAARSIAALVFEIEPRNFLYPLMSSWPTQRNTAETFLIRRDGDTVLYLNNLRFMKKAGFSLRLPLSTKSLVSAMVLRGKTGVLEGLNYRNVPVLAAAKAIPHSPWMMIAQIDADEVGAPIRKQALYVGTIVILMIGLGGVSSWALWRRQSAEYYRLSCETQAEQLALLQRFEHLSRHANDIIIQFDRSGNIVEANDRALAAYGYSREEMLMINVADLKVSGETAGAPSGAKGHDGVIFETVYRRKDGTTFPAEESSRVIDLKDGEITVSIIRDITERKETDKKIAHANRLYGVLSRINETIVRVTDRESLFQKVCHIAVDFGGFGLAWIGTVDRANNMLRPAFHCGADADLLEDISLPVDNAEKCDPAGRAAREDITVISNDISSDTFMLPWREKAVTRGYRSCGFFPMKVRGSVTGTLNVYSEETGFFNDAEIKLLKEIADDISFALENMEKEEERRRFEKALSESEAKYRSLVDNAPVGIYKTTLDGRFIFANETCARMFGFESGEELISSGVLALYERPAEREAFLDLLKERGSLTNYDLNLLTKDGEQRKILITAVLEGDVLSGMLLNVTEARKLEEQLRQAQKMEAVGLLAGGVSHDFNNILSAIIGYGQFLEMKIGPADPLKFTVEQILAAARRGAEVTRRLLAFSRKQILEVSPIDLNEVIRNVEKLLASIMGEDIELRTVLRGNLRVLADRNQLEQVLMNLAANARDAMPQGGLFTITSEPVVLDDEFIDKYGYGIPGEYALVYVTDTGAGMTGRTRERAFEPFFTTKEVGKGTGLGLAMVYGIIKQHNGFIDVYSEEEKGTIFRIYLPLTETADGIEGQPGDLGSHIERGSETVLVAEDDAALRRLSTIVLSEFGYTVITAEDGEDVVRKYAENKESVGLIIMDVIMPKKNGGQAYEDIKKIDRSARVLFVSGYAADGTLKNQFLPEGADFIMKPVSPRVLLEKVREILDRQTA